MNNQLFNINRIVKIKYLPGFRSDWHTHEFYHYVYVLNGTGIIKIEETQYVVQQDEFYFIPPNVFHEIVSYKDYEFNTIEIKFVINNSAIENFVNELPDRIRVTDLKIRYCLEDILKEATDKEHFFHDVMNMRFGVIMLNIVRSTDLTIGNHQKSTIETPDLKQDDIQNVFNFIDKNIHKQIEIRDLARLSAVSESYFYSIFKKKTGVSPNQYINNLRLAKAKELMLYSDLNITQIADSLGFSSLHYFSNFFKKWMGISPHEYIEKVKNDIRIDIAVDE